MTTPTGPANLIQERCAKNAFYRAAFDAEPAYGREIDLLAKAIRCRGDLSVVKPLPLPPTAELVDGWLAALTDQTAAKRAHEDKTDALNSLIVKCHSTIQGIATNREARIAALAEQLPALKVGTAAAIERLEGAHDPRTVLATGRNDIWLQLEDTWLPAHSDFYQAFDWLCGDEPIYQHQRSEYLADAWCDQSRIRNLSSIFPAWKRPAPDIAVARWDRPDPRPWPLSDPVSALVWLYTHGAELWAPTPRQLRALPSQLAAEPIDTDTADDALEPDAEPYKSLLAGPGEAQRRRIAPTPNEIASRRTQFANLGAQP